LAIQLVVIKTPTKTIQPMPIYHRQFIPDVHFRSNA